MKAFSLVHDEFHRLVKLNKAVHPYGSLKVGGKLLVELHQVSQFPLKKPAGDR